jgi:hypothetical protein
MVATLAVFWMTTLFRIDGMIEWAGDSADVDGDGWAADQQSGTGHEVSSHRIRQIERILREDPRTYWGSPDLQHELRELLAKLHGGEHDPLSLAVGVREV